MRPQSYADFLVNKVPAAQAVGFAPEHPSIDYRSFIERKSQLAGEFGFAPMFQNPAAYDFQSHLVDWAVRQGRAAIFADCGLGKTLMQLTWAHNVNLHTNKPVLIIAPLSVSHQTVDEATKFGYEAERSLLGKFKLANGIVTTNYERLHHFDHGDFSGVVCDECFAAGTEVDTPSGKKHIEDLNEGDLIVNAYGIDRIIKTHSREVFGAVKIRCGISSFIASHNHPILTER